MRTRPFFIVHCGAYFGVMAGCALLCICVQASLGLASAATCSVPTATHPTIQSAANDSACSEISLGAQTYVEQVTLGRASGITLRGVGAGRTILQSPSRRVRSSVLTAFLPNYTYVVQVKPGTTATLRDLTIDGLGNASCGERYFGIRYTGASGELSGVVVKNVRGSGADFACKAVTSIALSADLSWKAALSVRGGTVVDFQQIGILAHGKNASLSVDNTVVHGAGAQSVLAQVGVQIESSAGGRLNRVTLTDLKYSGDPCAGIGTAIEIIGAAPSQVNDCVVHGVDRGIFISKNKLGPIEVANSRFSETLSGILSADNSPGGSGIQAVQIRKNGFMDTRRSSADPVSVERCFAESGDAIAVRNEQNDIVQGNSAAASARCAFEFAESTASLEVAENQAVRSGRVDFEDRGSGNRLSKNLCQTSSPGGLCAGAP